MTLRTHLTDTSTMLTLIPLTLKPDTSPHQFSQTTSHIHLMLLNEAVCVFVGVKLLQSFQSFPSNPVFHIAFTFYPDLPASTQPFPFSPCLLWKLSEGNQVSLC